jgi:hypothetical protein
MIDEPAGRALGAIIVQEVARHPQLFAVAISYETAQSAPALYLAYETAEHCMERLRSSLSNTAVGEFEARTGRYTGDDEHFAVQDRLRDRIGSILNTGNWINPADPVLLDRDPIVDAWAKRAFQAVIDALSIEDEDAKVRAHTDAARALRGTLWFAIDHARRQALEPWPPVSFVQSVDDYSDELITTMATRKPLR